SPPPPPVQPTTPTLHLTRAAVGRVIHGGQPPGRHPREDESTSMSSKELRVAVVGAGRWAERAHIPGWQRDPRVEVGAVVDSDADLARRVAKEFGVARAVTDYRELLDDPAIDVIDVATGNEAHFQISWDSLQAGN